MHRLSLVLIALCLVLPVAAWSLGGVGLWWLHLAGYLAAAAMTLWLLHDDGELRAAVSPRAGDMSLGFGVAALLYLPTFFFVTSVLAPAVAMRVCTPRGAWVGLPDPHGARALLEHLRDSVCVAWAKGSAMRGVPRGVLVVAIAAAEEIAWRGGVQHRLADRLGSTRAWLAASALYALAHLATGNLSLALLALPTGLAWGLLFRLRGTLVPSVISHALFSFFFLYNHPLFAVRGGGL